MRRDFDNILDECLERVLIKGETIDKCLAGYPEYADELEPLLRTALDAREAAAIKPRPEFTEKASYQFQVALQETESKKSRGFFGWQPQWAAAVIVVIVLLAGSGTVAAANNSMPDEPLYQVKLATESVRLILTPSALGKEELYVKLADKRVGEIIKMAEKGKVKQVEKATERLDECLIAMSSLAMSGGGESVGGGLATSGATPPGMTAEEAPQAQVGEEPSAMEKAPILAAPKAPGSPEGTVLSRGGSDKGFKVDKQAKLRMILSRRAAENPEALRVVLKRAPESVKPALRQAIEVAGAGYERALKHLD